MEIVEYPAITPVSGCRQAGEKLSRVEQNENGRKQWRYRYSSSIVYRLFDGKCKESARYFIEMRYALVLGV